MRDIHSVGGGGGAIRLGNTNSNESKTFLLKEEVQVSGRQAHLQGLQDEDYTLALLC